MFEQVFNTKTMPFKLILKLGTSNQYQNNALQTDIKTTPFKINRNEIL